MNAIQMRIVQLRSYLSPNLLIFLYLLSIHKVFRVTVYKHSLHVHISNKSQNENFLMTEWAEVPPAEYQKSSMPLERS